MPQPRTNPVPLDATWCDRTVLITGGCSFIGSHLSEALLHLGARVRVVDNLVGSTLTNLATVQGHPRLDVRLEDVTAQGVADATVRGASHVFHLAAVHGGRGFIERHADACAHNRDIDDAVLDACMRHRPRRVVFASTACVYPTVESRAEARRPLRELDAGPPASADGVYGRMKRETELRIRDEVTQGAYSAASCRLFTVYGPRAREDHALVSFVARALVREASSVIWGDGSQVRSWTYVGDVVRALITAAVREFDLVEVNIGSEEATSVARAVDMVAAKMRWQPRIRFDPRAATGPWARLSDSSLAAHLLGWRAEVELNAGLDELIEWYCATHDRASLEPQLASLLITPTSFWRCYRGVDVAGMAR